MDVSIEMVISYFFLVVVFLIDLGDGQKYDCPELSSCGSSGPPIRFPFRLNSQPEYLCGYPGFNLSCTHRNETVLELPNSVKLFVTRIDYLSQVIQLTDAQHCLPGSLRGLDISSSPFQFRNVPEYGFENYSFFSYSREGIKLDGCIPCISDPNHQVCAFDSYYTFDRLPNIASNCTKLYDLLQIPRDIAFGGQNFLELQWLTPACGHCEEGGKKCRLKNNRSGSRTECFAEQSKGGSIKLYIGAILGSFLLVLVVLAVFRVYRYEKVEKENRAKIEIFLEDYRNFKPTRYSYADIKRITSRFTEKLGQGTYGTVFKRKLSNEILVAVKILNPSKGNGEEFINEVGTIGKIHHVNVVRLVGFCADGFRRALVYEFLPNNSLEKFIGSADTNINRFLGWEKLQDIAIGTAKGVEYLHQGCDQRILHFDIEPHNVLLDRNFNPKISDFGLAKLCSKDQSLVSMTTIKGTMGYIAPEVFSRNFGNVSYKADVYSFGMLLLEIVGGRKNKDLTLEKSSQVYFPEWIYNLLEENEDVRLFVEDDGDAEIAKKLAIVGLWCIQWHPMDRPSMKLVVQMLEGEGENLTMPPNPFTSSIGPTRIKASMHPRRVNQELEVIPESE